MSVEQQQQLTAIELTKSSNNNNNNSNTNTLCNNNNSNNNSSLNLQHGTKLCNEIASNSCELKHNDIFLKTKDSSLDKSVATCPYKQNGQHYVHETKETNGDHLKHPIQQQQHEDHHEKEKEQKDVFKEQQRNIEEDQEQDDEEEDCSLNTACIIKTPLNKTLLKKCTPNGNEIITFLREDKAFLSQTILKVKSVP